MKSKIVKLFDMKELEIPSDLLNWHMSNEEIDAELNRLAASHPVETHPNTAETGDSVLCRAVSDDPKWNREAMPIYPGRGMLEATLENAVVGMKVAESKTVGNVTLTVLEITRRRPSQINDELIKKGNIDGVETVEQYRAWLRQTTELDRKRTMLNRLAYYLLEEVAKRSEMEIDDEEFDTIAENIAKKQYQAMVNAGIDPTIPEDGVDFLTEEEALAKMAAQNRERLRTCVVNEYYATVVQPISPEDFETAMRAFEQSMGKNHEELIEYAGEILVNDYIYGQVFSKVVSDYAEALMEG